jgi:hypothetical protein
MKRRIMIIAGMLAGNWFSAHAQSPTPIPTSTAAPTPIAMPEPSNIPELGLTISALLTYCWWRLRGAKQQDS